MYNASVLGSFLVSLLFDDLSGHSYPSTIFNVFDFFFRARSTDLKAFG